MLDSLFAQFDRIVVFDTETTGIEFGSDEIIELGAVSLMPQGETDSMDLLIRLSPGRTLPPLHHGAHRHHAGPAGGGGRGKGGGLPSVLRSAGGGGEDPPGGL